MITLAVLLAGAIGAVVRFLVDGAVSRRWPGTTPWGTFVVNVSGSALLGVLAGAVMFHGAPHDLQTIFGVGFCGGYTTFSTASVDVLRLAQVRRRVAAGLYAAGTLITSVLACSAGVAVVWALERI